MDEQQVLTQEQQINLAHFTLADVPALIDCARQAAGANFEKVVVAVYHGTRLVGFNAGTATTSENNRWATRKYHVVAQTQHSSLFEKLHYGNDAAAFYAKTGNAPADFAFSGGGFPIHVNGYGYAGALIVSGLKDTEDHDVAYRTLTAFQKRGN